MPNSPTNQGDLTESPDREELFSGLFKGRGKGTSTQTPISSFETKDKRMMVCFRIRQFQWLVLMQIRTLRLVIHAYPKYASRGRFGQTCNVHRNGFFLNHPCLSRA
jgi:hypothetical protein